MGCVLTVRDRTEWAGLSQASKRLARCAAQRLGSNRV
jgi:hypothetical protein